MIQQRNFWLAAAILCLFLAGVGSYAYYKGIPLQWLHKPLRQQIEKRFPHAIAWQDALLQFKPHPAITLNNMRYGPGKAPLLRVSQASIGVSLKQLLHGKLRLTRMHIQQARISFGAFTTQDTATPPKNINLRPLLSICQQVEKITISDSQACGPLNNFCLQDINMEIMPEDGCWQCRGQGQTFHLKTPYNLQIKLEVSWPNHFPQTPITFADLDMNLHLHAAQWGGNLPLTPSGTWRLQSLKNLQIHLQHRPQGGWRLHSHWRTARLETPQVPSLQLPEMGVTIKASELTIPGIEEIKWNASKAQAQLTAEEPAFEDQAAWAFTGYTDLQQPWVQEFLTPLLPPGLGQRLLQAQQLRLQEGRMAWHKTASATPLSMEALVAIEAQKNRSWQQLQTRLFWQPGKVKWKQGRLLWQGPDIGLAGHWNQGSPLQMTATCNLPVPRLSKWLQKHEAIPQKLWPFLSRFAGDINVAARLKKHTQSGWQCRLQGSLSGLTWQNAAGDKVALSGTMEADLEQNGEKWQLDQGELQLPQGRIKIQKQAQAWQGSWDWQNLAWLADFFPRLKKTKLAGKLAGSFQLRPEADPLWHNARISCVLNNVSLQPSPGFPPLENLSGRLVFKDGGLFSLSPLQGHLQKQPLEMEISIPDIKQFQAYVTLKAPKLKARSLFFRQPETFLYDLQGRLAISDQGMRFLHVSTHLAHQGTIDITGSLKWQKPLVGNLQFAGSGIDIDQVIDLWQGPKRFHKDRIPGPRLKMQVDLTNTTLASLSFNRNRARLLLQDGQLHINSIDFDLTPRGRATGQATVNWVDPQNPVQLTLDLAGTDLASGKLFNQVAGKKSILTGNAAINLNVTGPAAHFWQQATGTAEVSMDRGMLHRFQTLNRILSWINLSHIFQQSAEKTGRGMPIAKLHGNLTLDQGQLRTEDLFIHGNAMNMSLVGDYYIPEDNVDFLVGIKPLRTVDSLIQRIPIAGWLLTGKNKALVTAHFHVHGPRSDPEVEPVPIDSLSQQVLGIFQRLLGLPEHMLDEIKKDPTTNSTTPERDTPQR